MAEVELVVDAAATLGEGPIWDARIGRVLWLDIVGKALHRLDPATDVDESVSLPYEAGAIACRASGGYVVACPSGFVSLDSDGREATGGLSVAVEDDLPSTRMNDGKCDPAGRFWAGTMSVAEEPGAGTLYRLDADHRLHTMISAVSISNGLAWSPDGLTMYYIDSPTQCVVSFDFDLATGSLGASRPVVSIPSGEGTPDGMTIDAEGYLWVALWDGGAVRRYAPDGTLDRVVSLPVPRVTSCVFAGDQLRDLYITTAARGLNGLAGAGALYRLRDTPVPGMAPVAYAG